MAYFEYYHRFRDTYKSLDEYVALVKENLLDDTQFSDAELKLSFWLMVGNFWMAPIAFTDEDLFKLDHAQKVSIHLPRLINQMNTMDDIGELSDFNLTNAVSRLINRVSAGEVESTQLAKRNDTPKLGNNVDLLTDTYISESNRVSGDGTSSETEDLTHTETRDDTSFKKLLSKLSAVDYTFVETYINKFKDEFIKIKIGGEFFQ